MIALDGPYKGKEYIVSDSTETIIDYFRTFEQFYEVEYKRTDNGWVCKSIKGLTPVISEKELKQFKKEWCSLVVELFTR